MADNPKREPAALLIASGATVKAAAAQLDIGERTLYRWTREDSDFRKLVDDLRGQMLSNGLGRLADSATAAADVLKALTQAR